MKLFYAIFLCALHAILTSCHPKGDIVKDSFRIAEAQTRSMLNLVRDTTAMPNSTDSDMRVTLTPVEGWTSGFFSGCLWYLYDYTKDPYWKEQAQLSTHKLESIQYFSGHHDVGFMMNCSYGNGYRLQPSDAYKTVLINSARSLCKRYIPEAKTIRSWDSKKSRSGQIWTCPVIIDNMLNLELLFLATKLSGDTCFRNIAINHATTTMKNHLREDYSSFHVVNYDTLSGQVLNKDNYQGFASNSTWARGQAWGVYGFTMVYRETKNEEFLCTAQRMADYFIAQINIDTDPVPLWDFNAGQPGYKPVWKLNPKIDLMEKDASAAAIVASGLLELSAYSKEKGNHYQQVAVMILEKLSSPEYLAQTGENGHFLLKHSVGNLPSSSLVDAPTIYADYYYLEALIRYNNLKNGEKISTAISVK